MSGTKCTICGVSGTSTYKCCGNNKEVRIKQLKREIERHEDEIVYLQNEITELENEK